uniref:Uncharacterized protein n=1 Tax=viral metagenome TaxID=1070528 RepID=A0A6C0AKR4_9ZZZZ
MDQDTATLIVVLSTTILHVWIIYASYWWLVECS